MYLVCGKVLCTLHLPRALSAFRRVPFRISYSSVSSLLSAAPSSLSSVCQIEFKNICSTIFRSPAGYRRAERRERRVAQPNAAHVGLRFAYEITTRGSLATNSSPRFLFFQFVPRSDADTHTPARAHQREHAHSVAKINRMFSPEPPRKC